MMNKELLPDMTIEEATSKHNELKSLHGVMRSMLLEMRDRKGWKALGHESWEEYGKKEWGYGQQYLDRLATASRIESIVTPMGVKEISERHLRPLTQVPDDIKKQIWDQVNEEHKTVTAKLIEQAVRKYKTELEEEKDRVQNWRAQALEKRQALEEAEISIFNLKEAKNPPPEIVYVDDSKKVSEELKEELKRTKEKLKAAQLEKIEAIKSTREAIANGMDKTITDLQKRETAQVSRVEYLQDQINKMESRVASEEAHKEAQSRYKKGLVECAIALMVFDDSP